MGGFLRRLAVLAFTALAAAHAHSSLLGVGFLGDDARTLVDLDDTQRSEGRAALWRVDALHGRPLAAASVALSKSLHAREGRYTPGDARRLRLENIACLVLAALAMRVAVRRGIAPWTGDDHGRSAGFSAAALLMVHPLAVPAAGHLGDRGDLLALMFSLWAVAVYLAGRQARSRAGVSAAWILTVAAAASSPIAYGVPVVLAVLELASADRHRSLRRRVRTAGTTALAFSLAVLLERLVRALMGGEASHVARVDRDPLGLIAVGAEKLGVLVLPVNTTGVGVVGYALAVLAVLAALHPGFVAARAAPRLWGRILGAWAACIAAILILTWSVRSAPSELGDARALLAGAAVMAAGLGVASTALSGTRRVVLPGLAIAVYAPLAAGNGATLEEAARRVGETHAALLAAGERSGWRGAVAFLDPPRKVAGVTALRPDDEAALVASPFLPSHGSPFVVRGIPSRALRFWTASADFAALRQGGLDILAPSRELGGGDRPGSPAESDERAAPPVIEVPALPRGVASAAWHGAGASPAGLEVDPLRARALIATPAEAPSRSAAAPVLRWAGASELAADGSLRGAWVRTAEGWVAQFDLERSLAWTLSGVVESIWLPGSLSLPGEVRVLAAVPELAGVRPRVVGDDWTFDLPSLGARASAEGEVWVLARWFPLTRVYDERLVQLDDPGRGRVARAEAPGPLVWSLERRIDGVTVASARGER